MKSFLEHVAQDIIDKYGTNLSHIVVVFPNKRASLFLNDYLARIAQRPLWSPSYITISDLFRRLSDIQVADSIKLVCELYQSFCHQTGSGETLDKFFGWGQLMLTDFDDIDKNMADADRVFANVRDIHELDDVSYLTDEQRAIIRRFFSHFTDDHNTELKQRFLSLWSHFADIYHDFNQRLASQGLAYEGALYRNVVEALSSSPETSDDTIYLFVGFNLLQKVEQKLFSYLQQQGKAFFYWDFDHYYIQHHEAGHYIAQYLQQFPNELNTESDDIYGNFKQPKDIRFITAHTENIQARFVNSWLQQQQRYQDGRRTAIVLCNEQLLPTVIHCLPPEVDKVNITTGYPLSLTAAASFVQQYFEYCLGGGSPRLLRTLQRHPYTRFLGEDNDWQKPEPTLMITQLLQMLRQIATNAKEIVDDPLFQESIFRTYTLLNRIDDLIDSGDLSVDPITLQRLTLQLIQQTNIPFHGEPAEGVQIMGVLETRNLDFDHVLLLSCNEGQLPRGVNDSSLIPHSIRKAYELTTVDNKVSIYAYYFHRLLQRASDITIVYNSSTEDGQRGEMSRFMLQLLVESGQTITQHTLQSGQTAPHWQPPVIEKTPAVMEAIKSYIIGNRSIISPTSINTYMRCPLQFYYRYAADIRQPEVPDDEQELDNRIFGNIFHDAADIIYHQLPPRVDRGLLAHLLKQRVEIERAVDEAFHQQMPYATHSGLHIINREVIIQYLRQLISLDMRLAPFTVLGLEKDVVRPLSSSLSIGGRIDRLDLVGEGTDEERIRVVDYKTGSKLPKPLADVDAIFQPESIHEHADYYLQTFVYADIVSSQYHKPVSPALLFIQHAAAEDYDPTLKFGREPILDIAPHSQRFNELLNQKIAEIFSTEEPFRPTHDLKTCKSCPYNLLCRR